MRRVATVAAWMVLFSGLAFAQKPTGTAGAMKKMDAMKPAHVVFVPSEAKWSPAPPGLPAGAEVTILEGDPGKPGPFTLQIKMPDGYKVMPHWHPTDERQTVVQGSLRMGMGNQWTESEMKTLTAGGYVFLPKKNPHYVVAEGETILQVQATGPFDLTYINPSDDPRKK